MPIKDLQKKDKPGLTRAGVIRLGYKVKKCKDCKTINLASNKTCQKCGKSDWPRKKYGNDFQEITFPKAADHFVLTDAPGVATAIETAEPKDLRIYLPFDDIDANFPAYHQYWVASALVCRGDGETIQYAINPQTGRIIVRDGVAIDDFESSTPDNSKIRFRPGDRIECPGMSHHLYTKCQMCKPNAMLIVLLRDIPRLAYYQVATTSIHNIINLTEQMTYIKQTIGRLQGVPFILKLRSQKISVPKPDGGRQRVEKYLLSLEVDPEWVKKLMTAQDRLADPVRRLLAEQTEDDGDIIDIEPQEPVKSDSPIEFEEPPVWFAPNGGDDSDYIVGGELVNNDQFNNEDFNRFIDRVMDNIKFFTTPAQVEAAMAALEINYDPETEEMDFDTLARFADNEASQASEQERLL